MEFYLSVGGLVFPSSTSKFVTFPTFGGVGRLVLSYILGWINAKIKQLSKLSLDCMNGLL